LGTSGVATHKILMRVFYSLAYGGHLYLVCAVSDVTIWRHIHLSKPTFCQSLLTMCIYFYTHSLYTVLCATAQNINFQLSMLGYRGKYTQHDDTTVHNCKNIRLRIKTGD